MILYNASTSQGLRNFVRFLTNTNSTTFTDADINASINLYQSYFANEILASMDGWDFQGEIATTDMVANQQEYVFPTDILKIKRVELSYDSGANWYRAEQFDINQRRRPTNTASITRDFDTSNPYVDFMDNSLMLYPIPTAASTAGVKIWYEKSLTDLSADTDEPNFAKAYHKGLCYGSARDYFEKYLEVAGNQNKAQLMENNMEDIIEKMKAYYRMKTPDFQYTMTPMYVEYDYGNKY